MASPIAAFRPTIALLVAFLLIASLALPIAEGACPLVSKRSKTWSGFCGKSANCDKQCRTWETAKHGACHATYKTVLGVKVATGRACFCYFCKKHT
ncbi:defensin-like protein 19 [Rosa rugosa]|uniref:defensin-like protein 19 n=1 Tax=Rosa rugosa TaxID=74645 RepID=UPI002B409118|nr:defensin-like protein 19 [Rosa rugosa]